METWDTYRHLMGDEDTRIRAVIAAALGAGEDHNQPQETFGYKRGPQFPQVR